MAAQEEHQASAGVMWLPRLVCLLAVVGAATCTSRGVDAHRGATSERYDIPPEYLPPPGQCRIWEPGEPAGPQGDRYPVGRCSQLREMIPEGAWLVYRPADESGYIRVWKYGSDREVLFQRIYDMETGELVRHVGPAAGG